MTQWARSTPSSPRTAPGSTAAADRRPEQDRSRARAGRSGSRDERIVAVFPLSCATGAGDRRVPQGALLAVPQPAPVDGRPEDAVARLPRLPPDSRKRGPGASCAPRTGFRVVGTPPERGGARACAPRGRREARRRGPGRRGVVRVHPVIGLFGGAFDPAAQRARRASSCGATRLSSSTPRSSSSQGRPATRRLRRRRRNGSSSPARRSPESRSFSTRTGVQWRCCAHIPEWEGAIVSARRRRVRRLPRLEGARGGAPARAPRRCDPARLPARAARRRPRGAEDAGARRVLRPRAASDRLA